MNPLPSKLLDTIRGFGSGQFKARVMRAAKWSALGILSTLSIRFGSNLLMTRILVPEMFGVMAIASVVLVGLAMVSDLGIRQAVVQSARGDDADFLNTAWSIQIIRGSIMCLLCIAVGVASLVTVNAGVFPPKSVYASQQLPLVILALSVTALIAGFESTKVIAASRKLALAQLTVLEVVSQLMAFAVMLIWAWIDRSIWALVAGAIASSIARTLLSHCYLSGHRNHWSLQKSATVELSRFGRWMLFSSVLGFFLNNGDRLLLGGLVTPTELGMFAIAMLFISSFEGILSRLMSDVSFPALSEVTRGRPHDFKRTYYRFQGVLAAAAYSVAGVLAVASPDFIALLYDSRYSQAGVILQVMSISFVTIPIRLSTVAYLARGLPNLQTNVLLIRGIALPVFLFIGFHFFGFIGAVWGIMLSHFSYVPLFLLYNRKLDMLDVMKEVMSIPWLIAGLVLGKLSCLLLASVVGSDG